MVRNRKQQQNIPTKSFNRKRQSEVVCSPMTARWAENSSNNVAVASSVIHNDAVSADNDDIESSIERVGRW